MSHAPEPLGVDARGRPVPELHVARLGDVPARLGLPRPEFLLLVAMDATAEPPERRLTFATEAIDSGCIYACAWGPGCSSVDDDFEMVQVMRDVERDEARTGTSVTDPAILVMTTWHEGVPIEEAVEFWSESAQPSTTGGKHPGPVEDQCLLAVIVGDPSWAAAVRRDVSRRLGQARA